MPIPDTSHYFDQATKYCRNDWGVGDAGVLAALKAIHDSVTPLHTSASKSHSLTVLVRKHLDQPFSGWLKSSGFTPTKFSPLLKCQAAVQADDVLLEYSRRFVAICERRRTESTQAVYAQLEMQFCSTIDWLRDFNSFCHSLGAVERPLAMMESIDKATGKPLAPYLTSKRRARKVQGRRHPEIAHDTDRYVTLFWNPDSTGKPKSCLACDLPTEEENLRADYLANWNLEQDVRSHLAAGGEFTAGARNYSHRYCDVHSEVNNVAGNRRALRHRVGFTSILATLLRFEIGSTVDEALIPMECWRRFAALAMEARRCGRHVEKIAALVPILYDNKCKTFSQAQRDAAFAEALQEIKSLHNLLGLSKDLLTTKDCDSMPELTYRVAKSPKLEPSA